MGATTRLFLRETFPIFTAFVIGLGAAEKTPILYAVANPTNC